MIAQILDHREGSALRVHAQRPLIRGCEGSALTFAIIFALVAGLLITGVFLATRNSVRSDRRNADQSSAMVAARAAATVYEAALQSKIATPATDFLIPMPGGPRKSIGDLTNSGRVVAVTDPSTVPSGMRDNPFISSQANPGPINPVPVAPVAANSFPLTARQQMVDRAGTDDPTTSSTWMYWQILYAAQPDYTVAGETGWLSVFIRSWVQSRSGATTPIYAVAVYRAGSFAEYQLLTDTKIVFGDGTQISGPVHSNGIPDASKGQTSASDSISVAPGASVSCTGADARLSTVAGLGAINVPGCPQDPGAQKTVDLSAVSSSIEEIANDCITPGQTAAICAPPVAGQTDVVIAGNTVTVGGVSYTISRFGTAVLVSGTARVTTAGVVSRPVTVATRAGNLGSPPDIIVASNIQASGGGVVGLLSEGNVVVDTNSCPVSSIEGLIIARQGSLTLNPELMSQIAQDQTAANACGQISFDGAIASHRQPTLQWSWDNGDRIGFTTRNLAWDPRLIRRPPPYSPRLSGWQRLKVFPLNEDCLEYAKANNGSLKTECVR